MGACEALFSFCFNFCKVDNAFSFAQYRNLSYSNEATNYFCNRNILVRSNGGYDLRPQEHPFVDKHLRFDYFQSFDFGILDLV